MAFIPLVNGIRVAVGSVITSKGLRQILHVVAGSAVTQTILEEVGDIFETWLRDELMPALVVGMDISDITLTDVSEESGIQHEQIPSPAISGSITGGAPPLNCALVATLGTAKTGRSYRGRSYVPGIPLSSVTGSEVGSGKATAIAAAYADLKSTLATAGHDLVVASYQNNGSPRTTAVGTPVETISCKLRMDSQRRRLPEE